jgi:hypothetical protein
MFAYRHYDINPEVSLDPKLLEWPRQEEAKAGFALGCNQEYTDLRRMSWREAGRLFALEGELISRIERASDPDAEYDAIEEELFGSAHNLLGLDIGVAATVACLSASGCIPFTSCSAGVFGGSHQEDHPLIAFFMRSRLLLRLCDCATAAGVGLTNGARGCAVLYTDDIRKFRHFASLLLDGAGPRS